MYKTKRMISGILAVLLVALCLTAALPTAAAADRDGWIGAWSTSPVEFNWKEMLNLGCIKREFGLKYLTFRTRIQPTVSGEDVRITLSNLYGTGPLTVDAVTMARGYDTRI